MMRTMISGRRGGTATFAVVLLLGLGGPAARRAGAGFYNVTDLGNLGTNPPTLSGAAINASGQVTGYYSGGGAGFQGFLADHATMTGIGTLGGGGISFAFGINDAGKIVGYSNGDGFLYDSATRSMTDLTTADHVTFGGSTVQANAINNSDQIVGFANTAGGASQAFLYAGGTLTNLSAHGGAGQATDINAGGQVTGQMALAGANHAFLYTGGVGAGDTGGTIKDLSTIGHSSGFSIGYGVNASGEVVGASSVNNSATIYHAFLYNGSTMVDLTPGSAFDNLVSQANGINASGQVVGSYGINSLDTDGFLYTGGVLTDLNTLISPGLGLTITGAFGINDAGQIAAIGKDGQDNYHALLLTSPAVIVPEPPTLALICTGAVLGLGLRRKVSRRDLTAALAEPPATGG